MKMIAASRLRRAQERVVSARPFAKRMLAVLNGLVARVDQDSHPLLRATIDERAPTLLIVITADRGLCGSFNSNVIKAAGQFIVSHRRGREVVLGLVGRKGRDFFRRRGFDVRYEAAGIFQRLSFADAAALANGAIEEFVSGRVGSVHLVYNEFKSVIQQRVIVEPLLPIPRALFGAETTGPEGAAGLEHAGREGAGGPERTVEDYIYEPGDRQLFEILLPKHVEIQVYRALLESSAAEHGARMTAMDNATRNAEEMIETLTLQMNKIRQASITKEILEVVSGAEALR